MTKDHATDDSRMGHRTMDVGSAYECSAPGHHSGSGVPWARARELARAAPARLPSIRIPLSEALGLVLAEDLHARSALPSFDTVAMDGYAVSGNSPFRVIGQVAAGGVWSGRVRPGEAVVVSTGAALPAGATAVLRVEDARRIGTSLFGPPLDAGTHIRFRGEDAAMGAPLVTMGSAIGPATLGLAAACGHDDLLVATVPEVSLLLTGDELVGAGIGGKGQVRDALGPMMPALIASFGGRLKDVRYVRDEPRGALASTVLSAASGPASVVVVTGSTSVGRTDQLRALLDDAEARWVVDTVACRPGHPQLLAEVGSNNWVVGLPGNPFAGLVAAYTLLAPLLAGCTGAVSKELPRARVVGDLRPPSRGQTRLVPVVWDGDTVRAVGSDRPAFLRGAALADALAAVTADWAPERPVPLLVMR